MSQFSFPTGILGFLSASPTGPFGAPLGWQTVYNPRLDSNPLFITARLVVFTILPRSNHFLSASIHGLATASRLPLPRSGSGRRRASWIKVGAQLLLKKIEILPKLLGGSPGRSPGLLGGSGKAVLLGKLVDSMTWRLSPSTGSGFSPVLDRSGPGQARPKSKNAQKTEDNDRFDSRNAVFWAEMDDSLTQVGRRKARRLHPAKLKEIVSASPTAPFGGPNGKTS